MSGSHSPTQELQVDTAQADGHSCVETVRPSLPFVTVVMPVRNEGAFLKRSMGAVLRQDYPSEKIEVLICDGMSEDDTDSVIANLQRTNPNIRLLKNPQKIAPTGLNIALREARGEIIVRVDGHCEIASDYVSKCVEHLQSGEAEGVGGPIETIGETTTAATIAAAMSSQFGVGNSRFRVSKGWTGYVDTVAFPAYRREIFDEVGTYDEAFVRNQDDEYNYRVRKAGARVLLSADVKSKYYSRATLIKLWSQYFQYGYWKVWVVERHPKQTSLRQYVPPLFVLAVALTVITALFAQAGRLGMLAVLGAYTVANLAASTLVAARQGWRHWRLLPVCFGAIHFGYGMGFLYGVVVRLGGHRIEQHRSKANGTRE